jgi:hypothetical protein
MGCTEKHATFVFLRRDGTKPIMGSLLRSIDFQVDINDTVNMPYGTLQALFHLANIATKGKIVDIKIEFWNDDSKTDVICSYAFRGWICHYTLAVQEATIQFFHSVFTQR